MDISVVINTFNSGKHIRQCLEAVRNFDEIVICDMYSDDDTLTIAQEYGAKIVMHEPCNGIVEPARTFAVRQATKAWVLVVDSDEVIPEALREYLYRTIASSSCPDALWIPRKNFFMDKFNRASFPDYQLRFFRREKFIDWPVFVHARPKIGGNIAKMPPKVTLAIIHLEKNEISTTISKMNKYADLELDKRKNQRENAAGLLLKPMYRFFKIYIIKGGFRDGKRGLIFASIHAYYKWVIVAKMIERQNHSSGLL